ncbi:MAG TPA: type III pantothenate kinase [Burkholderiales bacterium]|nr:type III pantothenate kinase [Burkholderiales bacterium]
MILAIDSGNSRIKWGLHDGAKWSRAAEVERSDIESLEQAWQSLPAPARIVACNVAGDIAQARIARLLSRWNVSPKWCVSQKSQCGVENRYEDPAQLGADRWAALIGAWHLYHRACLVVNCGTALTVDALSGAGHFLGGAIAPGFELMLQSLTQNTAGLKAEAGTFQDFPRSTLDAIHTGAIAASVGVVAHMTSAMERTGHAPQCCVVSGGNARLIKPHIALAVKEVKHLVLEGLVRIALQRTA